MNRFRTLPKDWDFTGIYHIYMLRTIYLMYLGNGNIFLMLISNHNVYISEMYGKVVVASKVPLPNYRPDLDDKRPQREVTSSGSA